MSQERMHPEDARRETALEFYALYIATGTDDPSHKAAIREADEFLAELTRIAKPEAPKEDPSRPFRVGDRVRIKNSPYKDVNGCEGEIIPLPKHPQKGGTYRGTINVMTFDKSMQVLTYLPDELELLNAPEADIKPEFLAWRQKAWDNASRAEKAEDRVKELESYVSVLVHGERNNDLVFALWNETCGGASADKAAADLRSMIANLENNLDNSKARVKELEDAIRFHQSSLVAGHEVDRQLWLKVK